MNGQGLTSALQAGKGAGMSFGKGMGAGAGILSGGWLSLLAVLLPTAFQTVGALIQGSRSGKAEKKGMGWMMQDRYNIRAEQQAKEKAYRELERLIYGVNFGPEIDYLAGYEQYAPGAKASNQSARRSHDYALNKTFGRRT